MSTVAYLEKERLDSRYEQIQEVYRSDNRPWVIGYSGGKDSTTALQLIWYALAKLPREELTKPIYVISSDTLVETPKIVDYINTSLGKMDNAAQQQGLPFTAHKVRPTVNDTFWVNLIGRGYPTPSKRFRWCTDRMKINPANHFILEKVAEHGEVVVVLGVRRAESATRAQVMSLHKIKGTLLSRHSSLAKAYVYTPIEDFSVDDVWTFLLQAPCPWGSNNRDLVTMYRNAQAGECPLVVDTTTPSCGNSRFGCWVCTVVTKDKSMEAMIDNGEEWMEPMLQYRDLLASTQDPLVKAQVRELKRRDGRVMHKSTGGIVYGPYKFGVLKDFLKRLLEVQKQVRVKGPNPQEQLITFEELQEIRRLWRSERQDWEDSVPRIYREVMGENLEWIVDEQPGFSGAERKMLDAICERHDLSSEMVAKLLEAEREHQGMTRRAAIYQRIAATLEEDWRTREQIMGQEPKNDSQ